MATCGSFRSWITADIEEHIRTLNQTSPIAGLWPQVERGEITSGQWLLYVSTCLQGQILNGGLEAFVFNCPGLVIDARLVIEKYGAPDLADAYHRGAAPAFALFEKYAAQDIWATGDGLDQFWAEFELIEISEEAAATIELMFYQAKELPASPALLFSSRAVEWSLAHPEEFMLPAQGG